MKSVNLFFSKTMILSLGIIIMVTPSIFAKKYDVLVIIVAHPTKMYRDKDGNFEEPNMYNIKGGGEWYDASYHGLLVHRNYEQKTV